MSRPLVFTDLDGTLLDHHTYRFDEASEMLGYLKAQGIPLIIVTSKTRPEVLKLQQKLGICEPFIVENGAGAFVPAASGLGGEATDDPQWRCAGEGKPYLEVRLFLKTMQERFDLRGFGDMEVTEVMERTGLAEADALDAMKRDFTEPFVVSDPSIVPELTQKARDMGLDIIQGGRFYHLITRDQTKGAAVARMADLYAKHYGEAVETIALGDSENDFSMLEAVDKAVLIPRYDCSYAPIAREDVIRAPYPGPKGWNKTLKEILDVCQR